MQVREGRSPLDGGGLGLGHAFVGRDRELGQARATLAENDTGRLAAIDTERGDIERQLDRGNMGDTIDQLRKNISKAIVRARAAIRRRNASFGEHLEECIAYERYAFRYEPPAGIRWKE